MTLQEAVKQLEAMCAGASDAIGYGPDQTKDKKDWSRAPTGDRYIVITQAGIKPEAESDGPAEYSESAAVERWLSNAVAYADIAGKGTLYWRQRPQIRKGPYGKMWRVYSRLFVARP